MAVTYSVARTSITIALSVIATINSVVSIASNTCFMRGCYLPQRLPPSIGHSVGGRYTPEGQSACPREKPGLRHKSEAPPEPPHLIASLTSRLPPGWNRSDWRDRTSHLLVAPLPVSRTAPGFRGPLCLAPCDTSRLISSSYRKPGVAAVDLELGAPAALATLVFPPSLPLPLAVPPVPPPGLPQFAQYDSDAAAAFARPPQGRWQAVQTHRPTAQSRRYSRQLYAEVTSNRRAVLSTPFPLTNKICGGHWKRNELPAPSQARGRQGFGFPDNPLSYRI